MIKNLVALMRPKHYLKNGLIFVPLVFGGQLFDGRKFLTALLATITFSAVASIVYIINDIRDVEKDRLHPKKKFRPIASGAVSKQQAVVLVSILTVVALALGLRINLPTTGWLLLVGYLIMNLAYSFGLKNVPIVDVGIIALGFVLRVVYGGVAVDIAVSRWLYLTVLAVAFYASLGKRRNEMILHGHKTRKVNEYYTLNFLDKNMYVCLALTLVFYSLWATDPVRSTATMFWTIPVVIMLLMSYSHNVEKAESSGDPVEVIMGDRTLALTALAYVALTTYLLYV